jgi:hypothetical protein
LNTNKGITNGTYFTWSGDPSAAFVRVYRFDGSRDAEWGEVCDRRAALLERIRKGWGFNAPRATWKDSHWSDHRDWFRILGDRRSFFQPNLTIEIGYGKTPFFFEAFRFAAIGRPTAECGSKLGEFCRFILEKLPPPGVERGGVVIRDLEGDENQIFWLGIVLQASRQLRQR